MDLQNIDKYIMHKLLKSHMIWCIGVMYCMLYFSETVVKNLHCKTLHRYSSSLGLPSRVDCGESCKLCYLANEGMSKYTRKFRVERYKNNECSGVSFADAKIVENLFHPDIDERIRFFDEHLVHILTLNLKTHSALKI